MKQRDRWLGACASALLVLYVFNGGATQAADYVVRSNDKLKIKMFQYPELSGEYLVGVNETISIAEIGEISVRGLSTDEVADRISQRIVRAGLSSKPGISVEIIQTSPVYILGDVQKPGDYAFRPGVTVLQAISLAGGWLRFNDPGLVRIERDVITAKGELRNLVRRTFQLQARRARLNAELAMDRDVRFSPELLQQAQRDSRFLQLLDGERSLLANRVTAIKTELEHLDRTRDLYQQEIQAVSRQIKSNQAQSASIETELKDLKALAKKGLVTASRVMNLERMQEQLVANEQGFQTLILRSREAISQLDQRSFDLKSKEHAVVMAELHQTRADLDEIDIKFETSRNLLIEAQLTAPTLIGNTDGVVETRKLTIVRVENGKEVSFEANESTPLLPGDVVRVQRNLFPTALGVESLKPRDVVDSPTDHARPPVRGLLTRTRTPQ